MVSESNSYLFIFSFYKYFFPIWMSTKLSIRVRLKTVLAFKESNISLPQSIDMHSYKHLSVYACMCVCTKYLDLLPIDKGLCGALKKAI